MIPWNVLNTQHRINMFDISVISLTLKCLLDCPSVCLSLGWIIQSKYFIGNLFVVLHAEDKRRSKNLSSGNVTVDTDAIEPCDHHLDCLPGQWLNCRTSTTLLTPDPWPLTAQVMVSRRIVMIKAMWQVKHLFLNLQLEVTWFLPPSPPIGSCCDLRQHECKPHNRGLNNKCYDDCMCEEGE